MTREYQTDDTIDLLTRWAERRDDVRVLLITSTRAVPNATLDAYSDYDVILVVDDVQPFVQSTEWLRVFGDVLVVYQDPITTDPETGASSCSNVTQFDNGLKIDFGCWPIQRLQHVASGPALPAELDAGYQVLLDKDHLTAELAAPTYAGYIPPRPDQETYLRLVNDFFVGPPYVAKCLLRGDLLPARWCLDYDMRYVYFLPMLEWRAECDHSWSLKPGRLGKGLQAYLPQDIWAQFESTFAGADVARNWEALFQMMSLFGQVARDVAACLSFTYRQDLESRVTAHVQRMREGVFAAGPLTDS